LPNAGLSPAWSKPGLDRRQVNARPSAAVSSDIDLSQHASALPESVLWHSRIERFFVRSRGTSHYGPLIMSDVRRQTSSMELLPCADLCSPLSPPFCSWPPSDRSPPPRRVAIASKAQAGVIQAVASSPPSGSAGRPLLGLMPLAGSIRVTRSHTNDGAGTDRIPRRIWSMTPRGDV
jgi:hypothetical protein